MPEGRLRPRVLLVAYACDPHRGSEEGVGWGWVRAIAQHADVEVLTAHHHRASVLRCLPGSGLCRVGFRFVPPRPWHYRPSPGWRRIEGSILKPLMNWAYARWLDDALRVARRLHRARPFDLVHLVTYVGYRFPGRFWQLGIPFVWGPIGGLENTPWRFLPALGWSGALYYTGRNLVNDLQRRVLPGPRRAFRRASAVIAATGAIEREIRRWYGVPARVISEVGLPDARPGEVRHRGTDEPLRLVWSGEHLPGKALPLLFRALVSSEAPASWRLTVLGEGPCTAAWRKLSDRLGLADRCEWTGWIPREAALATMRASHLLVVTSMKDLTSTVVLEGMSLGLAVVCPDHCGFPDAVTSGCGLRVPVTRPAAFVSGLARALRSLHDDEALRRRLAAGALRRAEAYSWNVKALKIRDEYSRVLGLARASA